MHQLSLNDVLNKLPELSTFIKLKTEVPLYESKLPISIISSLFIILISLIDAAVVVPYLKIPEPVLKLVSKSPLGKRRTILLTLPPL